MILEIERCGTARINQWINAGLEQHGALHSLSPEAVIRLKQGFGRLIRHSEDRGAVVILDSRIATKRYGQLFIQSLPECRLVAEGLGAIEKEVAKFLFDW